MIESVINEAIAYNCQLLNIAPPVFELVPGSKLATPTTMAALTRGGKYLAINKDFPLSGHDIWFTISHEMRHKWQLDTGFNLDGYFRSNAGNVVDYNSQAAEIDAHAWAVIVMANALHLRPMLREALGGEVWAAIERRIKEISEGK